MDYKELLKNSFKVVNVVTGEESTVFKVNEILTVATYTAIGGNND